MAAKWHTSSEDMAFAVSRVWDRGHEAILIQIWGWRSDLSFSLGYRYDVALMRQAINEAKRVAKLQDSRSILLEVDGDAIAGEFLEDLMREKSKGELEGFDFRIAMGRRTSQADPPSIGTFRPGRNLDGRWKRFHNAFRQTELLLLKAVLVAMTAVTSLAYIVEKIDVLLIHNQVKSHKSMKPPDVLTPGQELPPDGEMITLPGELTPKQKAALRDQVLEEIRRLLQDR